MSEFLSLAKLRGDLSSLAAYLKREKYKDRDQGRKCRALELGKVQRATLGGKRAVQGHPGH